MKKVRDLVFGKVWWVVIASILITACYPQGNSDAPAGSQTGISSNQVQGTLPLIHLSLSEAERIMGEPMHLTDSTTSPAADVITYQSAYKANMEDTVSRKTGAIYFLLQAYKDVEGAKSRYSFIKNANEDHGIRELTGVGDEAYFHSDGVNFYFVMVRKGSKVFNMKVNKITSTTSLEAFDAVARQFSSDL